MCTMLSEKLALLNACDYAILWVEKMERDKHSKCHIWNSVGRADRLFWLLVRCGEIEPINKLFKEHIPEEEWSNCFWRDWQMICRDPFGDQTHTLNQANTVHDLVGYEMRREIRVKILNKVRELYTCDQVEQLIDAQLVKEKRIGESVNT